MCEVGIIAANEALKEIIWISRLSKELVGLLTIPVLPIDNENAKRMSKNLEFYHRTKHINRKYLYQELNKEKYAERQSRNYAKEIRTNVRSLAT